MPLISLLSIIFAFASVSASMFEPPQLDSHMIYDGRLNTGYDMLTATSGSVQGWTTNEDGYLHMTYPAGQAWGAVVVTYGKPKDPPRPGKDISQFDTLSVEMRGLRGGEVVEVGMKDNLDPDDGTEAKVARVMTREWTNYKIPLQSFRTADLTKSYVIIEFVFGKKSVTVDCRNIALLRRSGRR